MIPIKRIEGNKESIIQGLKRRGIANAEDIIHQILDLNDRRKKIVQEISEKRNLLNRYSEKVKVSSGGERDTLVATAKQLREDIKSLEKDLDNLEREINDKLLEIPNVPGPRVPDGKNSADNKVIKEVAGRMPRIDKPLPHWEIGRKTGILDFDAGAKLSGSGFYIWKGKGCAIIRALINYFIDKAKGKGYEEIWPPLVVLPEIARGTGQLPDKDQQMYYIERDNLYLIPTAEVPVTNLYANMILKEEDLPVRHVAYSPCFRREAGSWGADVRGLNRVHQFDKVEIVQIVMPEKSYDVLDEMVNYVCSLVEELGLPYRVVLLCSGDLGFASACTYDIEIYAGGQGKYLETSSVSNFEDFQSVRMNLRVKTRDGRIIHPHTLNGSALAFARLMACIMENYQTEKGFEVPPPLIKYTGFDFVEFKK